MASPVSEKSPELHSQMRGWQGSTLLWLGLRHGLCNSRHPSVPVRPDVIVAAAGAHACAAHRRLADEARTLTDSCGGYCLRCRCLVWGSEQIQEQVHLLYTAIIRIQDTSGTGWIQIMAVSLPLWGEGAWLPVQLPAVIQLDSTGRVLAAAAVLPHLERAGCEPLLLLPVLHFPPGRLQHPGCPHGWLVGMDLGHGPGNRWRGQAALYALLPTCSWIADFNSHKSSWQVSYLSSRQLGT